MLELVHVQMPALNKAKYNRRAQSTVINILNKTKYNCRAHSSVINIKKKIVKHTQL